MNVLKGETNEEFQARWSNWLNTRFAGYMLAGAFVKSDEYAFDSIFCQLLDRDFAEFMEDENGRFGVE